MRILVVNPNTSASMTAEIAAAARRAATPGTEIFAVAPHFGPQAIDSAVESYLAVVAVMDRVLGITEPYDAVVLAGFGEHGRDALQELLSVPVLDIAESAAQLAMTIGRSFSVVTTLHRSIAAIQDRLRLAGLDRRCASVRACGLSTAEVDADPAAAVVAIVAEARQALSLDHAEVICLGCGGLAGATEAITAQLGVPVVDGVAAAVRLAEAVVGLGLSTSKIGAYADVQLNPLTEWPLSDGWQHAGRRPRS
jgi:allantoin racemase